MLAIMNVLTFGGLLYFVICGLKRLFQTKMVRSVDLICFVLFVFYGMPLLYDFISPPQLPDWFYVSWSSQRVRILYNILLLLSVILIRLGAHTKTSQMSLFQPLGFTKEPLQPGSIVSLITVLAWFVLLMPIPAVILFSPNPFVYLGYHSAITEALATSRVFAGAHHFISYICLASLGAFFLIYWVRTRQTRSSWDIIRWIVVFLALIAVFIHSKRTVIAFFLGIIFIVNFLEHRLRFSVVLLYGVIVLIGFYLYVGYQKGFDRSPLEYVRGDLARDYTLRHAIYRSGMTKSAIVPYRGSTYLFVLTAYVPRATWPNKPWPAPVYFTNDVFRQTGDDYMGWGYGFGFMEELIINFGYLGIMGCFFIGRLSRWLDSFIYTRSSYYAVLWLPLIFSCVFASSVILKLIMVMVIPAIIFRKVFAGPYSWLSSVDDEYADTDEAFYGQLSEDSN